MPAGKTYTPLATTTLTSTTDIVTFNSIPSTYTDLVLITNVKQNVGEQSFALTFNNDTGSNYSATFLYGNGSSALSGRDTNNTLIPIARSDTNNFWIGVTNIMNYSNSTTYKTVMSRGNSGSITIAHTGLWRNTAAITSLKVSGLSTNNFLPGSTFTLYGILAA